MKKLKSIFEVVSAIMCIWLAFVVICVLAVTSGVVTLNIVRLMFPGLS